jgi:protein involved in polysaccharide export with SLBB domain
LSATQWRSYQQLSAEQRVRLLELSEDRRQRVLNLLLDALQAPMAAVREGWLDPWICGADAEVSESAPGAAAGHPQGVAGVLVQGAAKEPGTYAFQRNETLSALLRRAGGLTPEAYPYGLVLLRSERRRVDEDAQAEDAAKLVDGLIYGAAKASSKGAWEKLSALASLTGCLARSPSAGRLLVEGDPAVLEVRPQLDVVIEPGDAVYVPRRPSWVRVVGAAVGRGEVPFQPGLAVEQFIELAGGYSESADKTGVYVILPNGSARPAKLSAWNYERQLVPPGSTIVIPSDWEDFIPSRERGIAAATFDRLSSSAAAWASRDQAQ